MALTADQIHGFSAALLHSRFDDPAPFPAVHLDWWKLFCSPHQKVAIAAPRGHAKSTAITHTCMLAAMLFRERDFGLIVSDTEGQAIQFLGDIKRELLDNDDLREVFGVKRLKKDSEKVIICEMQDGHEFCIMAKGSNQKVRGMKWHNKRPNLIICDDLENDEIVMNDERRIKFRQWLFNALLPAGSKNCIVRIVGTILHMDSALERLMPKETDPNTVHGHLAMWSKEKNTWLSVRYRAHNEDFSHILWPEMFSKERLLGIRQDYIEQGFPEGYSQEYLNRPIDEDNAYYKQDHFLPLSTVKAHGEYYIGADLAISEKDTRAYTVFVVGKLLASGILQIVDVIRFRGDGLEIVDMILDLERRYKPEWFAIEEENIAKSIGPFLREKMQATGVYPTLVPDMTPTKDKMKRGKSMQARVRAHTVEFDMEAPWWPDFMNELLYFPRGAYKDQADAFHNIGLGFDRMAPVPTDEELEEEEWEEEYNIYLQDLNLGESITGYGD
jgi:predicted phage terminase large subunit-like protein